MNGRILNYNTCMQSLWNRGILYYDEKGRHCVKSELCGNKSWGMIDFLKSQGLYILFR